MNHLRKAAALAAAGALCLFAACGSLSLTPAAPTASPQPDTDAAARARGGTLRLWVNGCSCAAWKRGQRGMLEYRKGYLVKFEGAQENEGSLIS